MLSSDTKFSNSLGVAYLSGISGADARTLSAGTVISLVPVVVFFIILLRHMLSKERKVPSRGDPVQRWAWCGPDRRGAGRDRRGTAGQPVTGTTPKSRQAVAKSWKMRPLVPTEPVMVPIATT